MVTYPVELVIPDDMDWSGLSNKQVIKKFKSLKNIKLAHDIHGIDTGFCYNYALGIYDEPWMDGCEDAHDYLVDFYFPIKISEAKYGDIIAFYNGTPDEDTALHFGIINETDGTLEGTKILSKWGIWGVYATDLKTMPEFYGNTIVIWRKK